MNRVFFTDRDLGKQFPAILAEAGLMVERHGDLFSPGGSDEQWLEHCGTSGRVALSHNKYIRYVPNELATVLRFRVPLIILVGQAPSAELARSFVQSVHRAASCRHIKRRSSPSSIGLAPPSWQRTLPLRGGLNFGTRRNKNIG